MISYNSIGCNVNSTMQTIKLLCCQDTPGFIVNRLLMPYLGEAVRMLERGKLLLQIPKINSTGDRSGIINMFCLFTDCKNCKKKLIDGFRVRKCVDSGWRRSFFVVSFVSVVPSIRELLSIMVPA